MPAATRTYWLTTACRIRRQDQSLVIERESGEKVHIPVTDVRDIVACQPVDINTAVASLLNRQRVSVHLLGHYGDYVGSLLTSETSVSGETVLAQARLVSDPVASLGIARDLVLATAFNVRRIVDRELLERPYATLKASVAQATSPAQLMGAEAPSADRRGRCWTPGCPAGCNWVAGPGGRRATPAMHSSAMSTASSTPGC